MSKDATSTVCVVAIPVRNERDRVVRCLQALENQTDARLSELRILLFLNNCIDDTRAVVEAWSQKSRCLLRVEECEVDDASAGWARRCAMELAATWLKDLRAEHRVLLTTDADSVVPADWISRNLAALNDGADAVAGRVAFEPSEIERFPAALRQRQKLECEYEALLAEIKARLDPSLGDPWPCHMMESGASIAVKLAAFRQVGGVPSIEHGEDKALIQGLLKKGLVVRHASDIVVMTSGRFDGRAQGGTAATLNRYAARTESRCDARLEALTMFVLQLISRRLLSCLGMDSSRRLVARWPLRPQALPRQIRWARRLLAVIRRLEARRDGNPPSASEFLSRASKPLSTS